MAVSECAKGKKCNKWLHMGVSSTQMVERGHPSVARFRKLGGDASLTEQIYSSSQNVNYEKDEDKP